MKQAIFGAQEIVLIWMLRNLAWTGCASFLLQWHPLPVTFLAFAPTRSYLAEFL